MTVKKPTTDPKQKATNEGDLAEGVLGAAIVAKIIQRQPNGTIGKVTPADVRKVLTIIRKAPLTPHGSTKTQVKVDVGGSAKDKIIFKLNLGRQMMTELRDFKDLKILDRISMAASSYVNSPRVEALAEAMYTNNINNTLEIDVDGISNNKGSKADVVVKTDKYVFEKISLKAGKSKTRHSLGQVGGNSWSAILRLFYEGVNDRTKKKELGMMLPLNKSTNENRYMKLVTEKPTFNTVDKAVRWAYTVATGLFNSTPSGAIAKQVASFLQFHSARGDTDVKIVILHLGTHKTLNPLRLEDSLSEMKLKSHVRMDTKWPLFIVYDASEGGPPPATIYQPNVLFSIRPRIDPRTDGYITHLVEEGPKFESAIEEKTS